MPVYTITRQAGFLELQWPCLADSGQEFFTFRKPPTGKVWIRISHTNRFAPVWMGPF